MGAIQETISSNWKTPIIAAERSKEINRNNEITKGIRVKRLAIYLIDREERPGTSAIIIVPANGRKIIVVR